MSIEWKDLVRESLLWLDDTERDEHIRGNKIYLTELTGCLKKAWYNIKEPVEEIDRNVQMNFILGKIYHISVQNAILKYLEHKGIVAHSEVPMEKPVDGSDKWIIRGRADIVVNTKLDWPDEDIIHEGPDKFIIELKTVRSLYYIDQPQSNHVAQMSWYMDVLGIKRGLLIYIQKHPKKGGNEIETKSFLVSRVLFYVKEIERNAKILADSLDSDVLPDCEPNNDWECKYCPYTERCGK